MGYSTTNWLIEQLQKPKGSKREQGKEATKKAGKRKQSAKTANLPLTKLNTQHIFRPKRICAYRICLGKGWPSMLSTAQAPQDCKNSSLHAWFCAAWWHHYLTKRRWPNIVSQRGTLPREQVHAIAGCTALRPIYQHLWNCQGAP